MLQRPAGTWCRAAARSLRKGAYYWVNKSARSPAAHPPLPHRAFTLFRSHWITLVGIFGAVLGYAVLLNLVTTSYSPLQARVARSIFVLGYGLLFWAGFWGAVLGVVQELEQRVSIGLLNS